MRAGTFVLTVSRMDSHDAPGTDSAPDAAPATPPAPTIVYPKLEATKGRKTTTYELGSIKFTVTEDVDDTHVFPTIVKNGGCGCGGGCGGAKKAGAGTAPALDVGALLGQIVARYGDQLPQIMARLAEMFGLGPTQQ